MALSSTALAFLVFGYVLGSIPFGLLLTRLAGLGDIRNQGSGNIGATNVLRTGKKSLALATLLLDAFKGALPVILAKYYIPLELAAVVGASAVLGHIFPLWLKFKGGKGVATILGMLLAVNVFLGLIACGAWLLIFFVFRYSSLASLSSMVAAGIAAYFLTPTLAFYTILFLALTVCIRHHANIKRLLKGKESKSHFKKTS